MWLRVDRYDASIVVHYVGLLVLGMAGAMLLPLLTAVLLGEWAAAADYVFGIGVSGTLGTGMLFAPVSPARRVTHVHGLLITAVAWLAASLVGAVPLAFSGNYPTYLDALFDTLSGFTTSGLTVVVDLDHMSLAHNMWRHLTHLIGGQGIVVAALSFAIGLRGGALSLYLAEGRDERILPNVVHTVRFIWFVTFVYITLGTLSLTGVNLWLGMDAVRASLHAFWISVAAYDTGGFAPQSMNALYYHSPLFETVTVFLMLAGAMNFSLHAQVWRGDRREIWRNIETRTLAFNVLVLSLLATAGLAAASVFDGPAAVVRKGVYHVLSAHSGTGHQTLYAAQWTEGYAGLAFVAVILAMGAGGAVSSTAGGIKALRLGVIARSVILDVKESIAPTTAVVRSRYHHLAQRVLTPQLTSTAAVTFILYTTTYVVGALIGGLYGYPAPQALFESVSATANVGLSTGITTATMPVGLKVLYMAQMWAGRLEFVAAMALVANVLIAVLPPYRRAL
ncbi:MAG: TrkH family potassium uptake protein [Coriobacteriia bacterium]|nr:TrkH family potassium uptake protein [Coriobacteriia bacterium]